MDGELSGDASSTREDSCHLAVYLLKVLYRYSHDGIPVSQLWEETRQCDPRHREDVGGSQYRSPQI